MSLNTLEQVTKSKYKNKISEKWNNKNKISGESVQFEKDNWTG